MPRTIAVYYRASDGSEPVNEFVDSLPVRKQALLDNQIDRLNGLPANAPPLPFPHSTQIEGSLRELRCHVGSQLYRVLYRRSESLFILLHIFEKKGARVPPAEIKIARARWKDFKSRMDSTPRKRPRAAGSDAP